MHRRLAALVGAAALVLASAGAVSADSAYPLSGVYFDVEGGACTSDLLLCTGSTLTYRDYGGGNRGFCLELRHSSEGIIYETEYGCWGDADPMGALHYTKGLLTSIGPTSVRLVSDLSGGDRTVTMSVNTPISTNIATFPESGTVDVNGCTLTWSSKVKTADTSGTMTVNGDDLSATGITTLRQSKAKTRC